MSIINDVDMDGRLRQRESRNNSSRVKAVKPAICQTTRAVPDASTIEMEQDQQSRLVQLGDASVASAFTENSEYWCALTLSGRVGAPGDNTTNVQDPTVNCLLGAYSSVLYSRSQAGRHTDDFGLAVAAFFFL